MYFTVTMSKSKNRIAISECLKGAFLAIPDSFMLDFYAAKRYILIETAKIIAFSC